MTFKEFLLLQLQLYFVLVTLIFAASMIVGMIFAPDEEIHYYQLAGPFLVAALCVVPSFVTYYKKEPTLVEFVLRSILQLALIEAIVLFLTPRPEGVDPVTYYVMIGVIVLVIYCVVRLLGWLRKYRQSLQLTEQLRRLQDS